MCNNPVLRTQSQFLSDLRDVIGKRTPTEKSLIVSINQALSSVGDVARSCMCVELPCPLVCGQCEYDLPCCDIDRVLVEVADNGCHSESCWHRLPWWDLRCGKLVTDGRISGRVRLTIYARNPDFGKDSLSLAKTMLADSDELWISGRVENLPPTGWVKVCSEWMQYLCWEHREIPQPDRIQVDEKPFDPVAGVDANNPPAWGVDPSMGFSASEAPCGTHTVLHGLRRRCNAVGEDNYAPGTPIELGLALPDSVTLEYLQDKILANSYRSLATGCTSGEDRQFYLQMMADSDARAEKSLQRRKPNRPIIKQRDQFAVHSSCCGSVGGCSV